MSTPFAVIVSALSFSLFVGSSACAGSWNQCGGKTFGGATCCPQGQSCFARSEWYSQCRPSCPGGDWLCAKQTQGGLPAPNPTAPPKYDDPTSPPVTKPTPTKPTNPETNDDAFSGLGALQTTGYYENWNNVIWWNDNTPGRCFTGCPAEDEVAELIKPYTNVIYSFVTLSNTIDYEYHSCEYCKLLETNTETGHPHDVCCPEWDGKSLYNAKFKKINGDQYSGRGEGARVISVEDLKRIDPVTNVNSNPQGMSRGNGVINVGEFCRMARDQDKACIVAIGGWSDWARIGTIENAEKVAEFIAELALWSFADGIDLDFEHLYEFEKISPGEEKAFAHMTVKIREQLDGYVLQNWRSAIESRLAWLSSSNAAPWGEFHEKQKTYLETLLARPTPKRLALSFTTRFNAFAPEDDPWNFLTKDSPVPDVPYSSHNEGARVWPTIKDAIDYVNIMAYDAGSDAGPLILDFVQIAKNFEAGGVPRHKIVMGYEPVGNGKVGGRPFDNSQAGGGIWEGPEVDLAAAKALAEMCFGGGMFWALNAPEALTTPGGEEVLRPIVEAIAAVHDQGREKCQRERQEDKGCAAAKSKRSCLAISGCGWQKRACVKQGDDPKPQDDCGVAGKLVKPSNKLARVSGVESACKCSERCRNEGAAAFEYHRSDQICTCFGKVKKIKKAKAKKSSEEQDLGRRDSVQEEQDQL